MTPEAKRLSTAATIVFAHLDSMVGDVEFAAHVDVLRRFVFGELGIAIGSQASPRGSSMAIECDELEALACLFRVAALVLPRSRLVTPAQIEKAVAALVDRGDRWA